MKLLVTGAAGFIGSNVAQIAVDRGHEVVGVDNLNHHYDPRLKRWRLEQIEGTDGFTFHERDIADEEAVTDLLEAESQDGDVDAVANLAARAGVRESTRNPHAYVRSNVTGTLNLLQAARRYDIETFLLSSTSSLYGAHNPVPFAEDANTDRPLSPYAATKKGAEALAASYAHLYGLDLPVPRYFTVYGPAGRPRMAVFRFIRWVAEGEPVQVNGDGTQKRDFTYVDDIARGTLACLEAVDGYEVLNLGNDDPVELNHLISLVEEELGRKADIERNERHPADVDATWADIGKARKLLDWEPEVDLREGVRRTARWYEENRGWAREIKLEAD